MGCRGKFLEDVTGGGGGATKLGDSQFQELIGERLLLKKKLG
jgi:hypothetical protein